MNTLLIISFRNIYYEMYCNFYSGGRASQNSLLISNFTIFESLLFEGYSCKRLQTLCTLNLGTLTLVPSPLINFGMANS
jgi:hypothetical protein